jgi:hypothetical protein
MSISRNVKMLLLATSLFAISDRTASGQATSATSSQLTAIFAAARAGDLEKLKTLIGNGPVDVKDSDGATPLFDAAVDAHIATLKWLLDKGANANSAMPNGCAALHFAVGNGQMEATKLLLQKGANVNAICKQRNIPASPLFIAMNRKTEAMILLLINSGADVNEPFGNGTFPHYPLEYAMWDNWSAKDSTIKALLAKGAKSPWLSQIKGFNAYGLVPLTPDKNEKGDVVVGSLPLFLGAYAAQRPWKLPPESSRSTTGTNFWRWQRVPQQTGPLTTLIITDPSRHQTALQLVPTIYIGDKGIAYSENVASVEKDGPFIDIVVDASPSTEKVSAVRANGATVWLTKNGTSFRATLAGITDYEPISVTKYGSGGVKQSTTDFDCIYRAAKSGAVIYRPLQ